MLMGMHPGRVRFGSVIRNEEGEWVLGFAGYIGITSNMHAKLSALKIRLQIA